MPGRSDYKVMRICGQDDTVIPEYQVIAASNEGNTEIYDEHTQLLCL